MALAKRTKISITPAIEKKLVFRLEKLRGGSTIAELVSTVYQLWRESCFLRPKTASELEPFLLTKQTEMCRREQVDDPDKLSEDAKEFLDIFAKEMLAKSTTSVCNESGFFRYPSDDLTEEQEKARKAEQAKEKMLAKTNRYTKTKNQSSGNIREKADSDDIFDAAKKQDMESCTELVMRWLVARYGPARQTPDKTLLGFGRTLVVDPERKVPHLVQSFGAGWAASQGILTGKDVETEVRPKA